MARTLTDSLSEFDDSRLLELFSARQDLTSYAPSTFASLAAKAESLSSVQLALASLRRPQLQLAEVFAAFRRPLSPEELASAVSQSPEQIAPHLYRLQTLGLIYSAADGRTLIAVSNLFKALPHPAQLAPHSEADPSEEAAKRIVAELSAPLAELAKQLAFKPFRIKGSQNSKAAKALLAAKVLKTVDTPAGSHLVIPRYIQLTLQNYVLYPQLSEFPTPDPNLRNSLSDSQLQLAATLQALEAVRIVDSLAELAADPPSVSKRGLMGIKDMKRNAQNLGVEFLAWSTVMQVAFANSLLGNDGETWQATKDFLNFTQQTTAQKWAELVSVWLKSSSISAVEDSQQHANAPEVPRKPFAASTLSPGVKVRRRLMLNYLADYAPLKVDENTLTRFLTWAFPLVSPHSLHLEAKAFLLEASYFGLVVEGTLSELGLQLALGGEPASDLLAEMIGGEVNEIKVYPDLSYEVSGFASKAVEEVLAFAEISERAQKIRGRFTAESIARALSLGKLASNFLTELESLSTSPLPAQLRELVQLQESKIGRVVIARFQSVVSGAEPYLKRLSLKLEALSINFHFLAPTVLLAQTDPGFLMNLARQAELSPVALSVDGTYLSAEPIAKIRGGASLETQAIEPVEEFTPMNALAKIRKAPA